MLNHVALAVLQLLAAKPDDQSARALLARAAQGPTGVELVEHLERHVPLLAGNAVEAVLAIAAEAGDARARAVIRRTLERARRALPERA